MKTLQSERLKYRKVHLKDVKEIYENWGSNLNVSKYVTWNRHDSIKETEVIVNKWIQKYNSMNPYFWVIEYENILIGSISVTKIDHVNKICEIGYVISEKKWGKGFATEALNIITSYLKASKGFKIFKCKILKGNIASQSVVTKCGYKKIGEIPYSHKGENLIQEVYALSFYNEIDFFQNKLDINDKGVYSKIDFEKKLTFFIDNIVNIYTPIISHLHQDLLEALKQNSQDVLAYVIKKNQIEYKKNLKEIIIEVIEYFGLHIRNIPYTIWLNGSYARSTNTYSSDIDLNFSYENKYYHNMIIIEETMSYILYKIYGLEGRDNVHPMGYSDKKDFCTVIISNLERDIMIDSHLYKYKLRNNSFEIMDEYFKLSRSHESIENHFSNQLHVHDTEWLHTFEVIYKNEDKDLLENFIESYNALNNEKKNKIDANEVLVSVNNIKQVSNQLKVFELKNILKKDLLTNFFESIIYFEKLEKKTFTKLDVNIFFDSYNIFSDIEIKYYNFLAFISKVKLCFEKCGIEFSSHNHDPIHNDFYKVYEIEYGEKFSVEFEKNKYEMVMALSYIFQKAGGFSNESISNEFANQTLFK